jgi:Quinohemoprotein amine dehydrogenase A, alpha subunit, haem binding
LLATACSQCHVLNVIMSMREGPAGWRRHVHNMVTRGAQLTSPEAETVIAYLAANFGPGSGLAAAAAVTLPAGAGKELVETRCTACHDLERVAVVKRQKADWPALVANMVGRGAMASPDEAQAITSYLAALRRRVIPRTRTGSGVGPVGARERAGCARNFRNVLA